MAAYEPRDFLMLDSTLLYYCGTSGTLQIPNRVNGQAVSAIGKGALAECTALKRVVLPGQISRIGDQAFLNCSELECVVFNGPLPKLGEGLFLNCAKLKVLSLHRLPVSEEQYRQLRDNCCPMEDGSLAALRFPGWAGLDALKKKLPLKTFAHVPGTVDCLLRDEADTPETGADDSSRFLKLIRRETETPCIPEAEEENDRRLRAESVPALERVALFCVNDEETEQVEEGRLLHAKILLGRFYWQSKVRIVLDQQTYYLYQRNYLSSSAKLEYIRKDMSVFTREGPVYDEGRVRGVCAKYQLSSIL